MIPLEVDSFRGSNIVSEVAPIFHIQACYIRLFDTQGVDLEDAENIAVNGKTIQINGESLATLQLDDSLTPSSDGIHRCAAGLLNTSELRLSGSGSNLSRAFHRFLL